jgi:hypothetical protein
MRGKQIKFQSDSVMADVYLGVTVAGLYTLVGMGLIIVLCEGPPQLAASFM